MLKRWLNFKIIILVMVSFFWVNCFAQDITQSENNYYADQTKLVSQQIDLLKNRLTQAQTDLQKLQKQQEVLGIQPANRVNKSILGQVGLDIAVAKSNLDSVNIELTESQQAVNRLEKDTQELQ